MNPLPKQNGWFKLTALFSLAWMYLMPANAQTMKQRAGMANVANLEGSIFQWANEGRPLFRGTSQVNEIHPYARKWARLLDPKAGIRPALLPG